MRMKFVPVLFATVLALVYVVPSDAVTDPFSLLIDQFGKDLTKLNFNDTQALTKGIESSFEKFIGDLQKLINTSGESVKTQWPAMEKGIQDAKANILKMAQDAGLPKTKVTPEQLKKTIEENFQNIKKQLSKAITPGSLVNNLQTQFG